MKKLKLKAVILSEFSGEINGCPVNNEDAYYSVRNILEYIESNNTKLTKWSDFIEDLIETFEALGRHPDFDYVYEKLIATVANKKDIDALTKTLEQISYVKCYSEFDTMYSRLKNNYYTS